MEEPRSQAATYNFTCTLEGEYDLILLRGNDACRDASVERAFELIESPPPGVCAWQPWAAFWTNLNLGEDLDPPNGVYNANNWDYTFSQITQLGMPQDTPDGSTYALHWFLDSQPGFTEDGVGVGGVYQELPVTPGVPIEYSFAWKGGNSAGDQVWWEFIIIDGPFSPGWADQYVEDTMNNPYLLRKQEAEAASTFGWTTLTDTDAADSGPFGPRPQTITPTGTVATVVLKAGRFPGGSLESFWDNVVVTQGGGSNLVTNGDFESTTQAGFCDADLVFADPCEGDFYIRSDFQLIVCADPYADADEDGDVDQQDFAVLQACFTGSNAGPVAEGCECFDRPEGINTTGDGDVDLADVLAFEACASGPEVPADPACDD